MAIALSIFEVTFAAFYRIWLTVRIVNPPGTVGEVDTRGCRGSARAIRRELLDRGAGLPVACNPRAI